mgnify:CR=1 FL=1
MFCLRQLEKLKKVCYCFIDGDADPVIAWLASVYKFAVISDDSHVHWSTWSDLMRGLHQICVQVP